MKAPPEKLGSFYLGAAYDLASGNISMDHLINYDARDLTTHGVCVGMTGSGKTGLCICLLEEAALDKVPALIVDPKGDITNLLLQFPDLHPTDFQPWVNPDDARRRNMSTADYAQYIADRWRTGLSDWGITSARIHRLQASADFTIYTPGSTAGLPISILSSLAVPALDWDTNLEAIRERIQGLVAALLSLVGVDGDPIRSRAAILLAHLIEYYWGQGEDLTLETLILAIQTPPIQKLGVFDVDSFYPRKERSELAIALNSLIAAPSFQSWMQGTALDIDQLLYTETGAPRHSIFYLAHLTERERMFFVTLLLENLILWMRRQSGTTSLRTLLYFDEVFGFFPPVAEPPSKRPLLTLMKQARAYGVGILLVTQNPMDLDYKGLTNTGTWFIGKLQTDRDKARVLQGLEGVIAPNSISVDATDYDTMITQLNSRVFLLHNIHSPQPIVFHTRWAISYLRGPLTRPQVSDLMATKKMIPLSKTTEHSSHTAELDQIKSGEYASIPAAVDPAIPQIFLPATITEHEARIQAASRKGQQMEIENIQMVYHPAILGIATIRFVQAKHKIDTQEEILRLLWPSDEVRIDWSEAEILSLQLDELSRQPVQTASAPSPFYSTLPPDFDNTRTIRSFKKDLANWLYYNQRLRLRSHDELNVLQRPDENLRDFNVRIRQAARETRDQEVDALEKKYDRRLDALAKKMRRLERDLADDEAEYKARQREEAVGVGETVLSFFMGRRRTSAATTIARRRRMTAKVKRDIEETEEEITELKEDIHELEQELEAAINAITSKWDQTNDEEHYVELKPRRRDVTLHEVAIAWAPFWHVTYARGGLVNQTITIPAYTDSKTQLKNE
jgi:hypothetical protein